MSISLIKVKLRLAAIVAVTVCLVSVEGQNIKSEQGQQPLDAGTDKLASQAADLAFEAGLEAAGLEYPERTEAQLEAARILSDKNRDASLRLLNDAWNSLNSWADDTRKNHQRNPHLFSKLRSQAVALYLKIDPEKGAKLAASLSLADDENTSSDENAADKPTGREKSDQLVGLALANIKADPTRSVELAITSFTATGKLSRNLKLVSTALQATPDLQKFESMLGQLLQYRITLDGQDLRAVCDLIWADPQMTRDSQLKFINFLAGSAARLAIVAREAVENGKPLPVADEEIGSAYFALMDRKGVRDVILGRAPELLASFDSNVDQIRTVTPVSSIDLAYASNTTDSLEQQLKRASQTANSSLRDLRLARIVFRAIAGQSTTVGLAADAVAEVSDPVAKAVLADYVAISRVRLSLADKNLELSEKLAREISKVEFRAWTLMALGTTAENPDRERLYAGALELLEKSSPSAFKVDLLLVLAEKWSEQDISKAAEIASQAIKVANQNLKGAEVKKSNIDLNGFFPRIGKLVLAAGDPPTTLGDVALLPIIGRLALLNWREAHDNSQVIQNLMFRVRYKLYISKAVLDTTKRKN